MVRPTLHLDPRIARRARRIPRGFAVWTVVGAVALSSAIFAVGHAGIPDGGTPERASSREDMEERRSAIEPVSTPEPDRVPEAKSPPADAAATAAAPAASSSPPAAGHWAPEIEHVNGGVPGRWNNARKPARPRVDAVGWAALANLPYTGGSRPGPHRDVVTIHDPESAHAGVNLVLSGHRPCAQLVDMDGVVLHEWSKDFGEVWPGPLHFTELPMHTAMWRRVEMLSDGGLLAIHEGIGMVKLNADSDVVWKYRGGCHHDLWVNEDGTITTLARRWRPNVSEKRRSYPAFLMGPYFEDVIVTLSEDGEELSALSILECFENSNYASVLSLPWARLGDVWHTNTVNPMDGQFADRHPMYAKGNLLVCLRDANTVAVLDPAAKTVVWAMTGMWSRPHEPTIVEDGRLLIFDNMGANLQSRVLEIDPLTQKIEWCYRGTEDQPFSSDICGSNQRLPNGNTLIVETTGGRAFEVTPQGSCVWEFNNPNRSGEKGEFVASLFDCVRLDAAFVSGAFPSLTLPSK